MKNLSRAAKFITLTNLIYQFGQGLASVFINIYLLRQLHSLDQLVLFNLIQFPAILAGYLESNLIEKEIKAKYYVQLGMFIQILAYFLIIFLKNNVSGFVFPLGFVFGLATGVYFAGMNVLTYLNTRNDNRDTFYGFGSSLSNFLSMGTPLISGFIISQTLIPRMGIVENYYLLFFLSSLILFVGIIFSFLLPSSKVPKVRPKELISPLKKKLWRYTSYAYIIEGLKVGSEGFITSYLVFNILSKELNIGIYQSLFSVINAIFCMLLAKRMNKGNRMKSILIGSLMTLFSNILYISIFSVSGLILNSIIGIIAGPLYSIGTSSAFFNALDNNRELKKDFNKYIVFLEFPMMAGRSLGALLFLIFLGFGKPLVIAKMWFLFIGLVPLIFSLFIYKFTELSKGNEQSLFGKYIYLYIYLPLPEVIKIPTRKTKKLIEYSFAFFSS